MHQDEPHIRHPAGEDPASPYRCAPGVLEFSTSERPARDTRPAPFLPESRSTILLHSGILPPRSADHGSEHMFGILDFLKVSQANSLFVKTHGDPELLRDYKAISVEFILNASPHRELWLCFPGFFRFKIELNKAWGVHNFLPKKGKVYLINGPLALAGFTPHESIEAIKELETHLLPIIDAHPDHSLNIFSVSAGTYPGFYFANKFGAKRLIAVAPGPRMGQGIYTSIFSRTLKKFAQQAGFRTWHDYDAIIAPYNQEHNVANLPTGDNLMVFGARFDRVIRNSGAREIVSICRKAGKQPTFRNYWFFGHTALGIWLGGMNKLGFDPYRLNGKDAMGQQSTEYFPLSIR